MIRLKRAQSTIEYTVLIIIILAVFLAMNQYIKRGFQGRMKASVDDFGDQYDPRLVNSLTTYSLESNSSSNVAIVPALLEGHPGYYTNRADVSNSIETKTGYTAVGSFDANGDPVLPGKAK
jgi:hypothetical protein